MTLISLPHCSLFSMFGGSVTQAVKHSSPTSGVPSSVHRRGVAGNVPAFQLCGPGSVPGGVKNFNFYPGTGCVSFVFCPELSLAVVLILY